ncbi:MAG: Iron-sulfur cluster repair di-iron protein [Fibrobacteres bacterium]|nr:Iron-sulfur cluster repair di-iron protein [Fibrobacterota bacterium]
MNESHRWVFPDTTASALLTVRPLSLSILEKYGMDPFTLPLVKAGDLCREKGISWDTFLGEMEALEIPAVDSEWSQVPLIRLLDYLTCEHQAFIRELHPGIMGAFWSLEKSREIPGRFAALIREWHAFENAFSEHIAAEESFLFPKILRYDYCVRHGKADPDFFKGSVRVFSTLQLHKNEHDLLEIIRSFIDLTRLAIPVIGEAAGPELELIGLLEAFDVKHQRHSRMEKEILVPMASALEKRLYDRFISGKSEQPHGFIPAAHVTRANEPF